MVDTVKNFVLRVLTLFIKLGDILERFFKLDIPDMTAEELLYSKAGMALVVGFICILPVLFITDALIMHAKRKRAGVLMKNRKNVSGMVTGIHWKRLGNGTYSRMTNDRYATVDYMAGGEKYILKCPAGEILKGDRVRVVYEKENPENAMLERDYVEGRRGIVLETAMASLGALVVLSCVVCIIIARI